MQEGYFTPGINLIHPVVENPQQLLAQSPSSLSNHNMSQQLPPFIHPYFEIPDHLDKFENVNARQLSDSQRSDIHKEVQSILSEQIKSLNPKKEKLYHDITTSKYPFRKMFLCTAWMRGFCMFPIEDCLHAHGVADLKYSKEDLSPDVNRNYKFIDHKQLVSTLSYVHLYEFSKLYHLPETSANTEYTLEEIFLDRGLRTFIRESARIKLFEDFFLLLVKTYSGVFLTEEFVSWEFSRVGAGSDALGFNIKAKRVSNILQRNLCYVAKAYHPPSLNHYFSLLVLRDSRLSLHQYFKEKVIQALGYLHKNGKQITESNIKKFVNESQITLIEPSFEQYLVKDNMCFFRFFKFYSLLDPDFLETCEKIGRAPTDFQDKLSQKQSEIKEQQHENVIDEPQYSLISQIQFDCCSEMSQKTQKKAKLIEEYLALQFKTHKRKLCRYWLRGQCMFDIYQCQFSHGIADLIYEKYGEDIEDPEYAEFAFQKSLWLDLSFISLFKEQQNLIRKGLLNQEHSLIELDTKKELREGIRAIMQQDAMEEFMELIWSQYGKNIILTQSFIVREFKRVGFFKIGYSLKNQGIFDILNITKTFPSMRVMPPLLEPGVVFLPFPTYQESLEKIYFKVFEVLKSKLEQENSEIIETQEPNQDEKAQNGKDLSQNPAESEAIKEGQQIDNQELDADSFKEEEEEQEQEATSKLIINEFEIKKEFYKNPDLSVPPIYQISKRFRKQVHEIIWDIFDLPEFQNKVKESFPDFDILTLKNSLLLDSDLELLSQRIEEQLAKRQHKISIPFWKLFGEIYPEFRPRVRASSTFAKFRDGFRNILETKLQLECFNLGSSKLLLQKKYIINQIKHEKSLEKKKHTQSKPSNSEHSNEDSSDTFYLNQYLKDQYQFNPAEEELLHRIIVVNTPEGVQQALSKLSSSSLIGVDLEGHLSQSGRIELVQMSQYDFKKNQAIIYVFDCLALEALDEIKQAVKLIMENQSITKILQGCQKDALALYHLFDSKIINAIDTQVVHNFIVQLRDLVQKEKLAKSSKKSTFKSKSADPIYYNCGLNVVLQIYKAPNGPNPLKNKFHEIFLDHELASKILLQRPLDTDYLVYSSKDVEDLIPVYALMVKETAVLLRQIFPGIESHLVEQILSNVSRVSYKYKEKKQGRK